MEQAKALAAAALLVALVSLGAVGYVAGKLSSISEKQDRISASISGLSQNVSRIAEAVGEIREGQNSSISKLASQIEALSSVLDDLSARLESLESNQTSQASNLTALAGEIEALQQQLLTLQQQLESGAANVSELESAISRLASRIDSLYQLVLFPVTVADATGEPVTIPSRPLRIVSLFPSVTEILWAVNASSQVVAVDSYSDYPPEVVELRENGTLVDIGSGWYPDVERILAVRPDLVIGIDSVTSNHQLKEELSHYGIPVILLPDATFGDVVRSIIIVGQATGHPAEAAALAASLEQNATQVRSYIDEYLNSTGVPRARVALIVWLSPLYVAGSGTFQNDIITLAGGVNAYSNITGWRSVNPESLVEVNPDVIIVTAGHGAINMTRQQVVDYLHSVIGDAVYNITAVQTNRIYLVSYDYNDAMVRPAPRVAEAIYLTSIILYPGAYNVDPGSIPENLNSTTFPLPAPPWQQG
ncbi:MAG: helical backbone metal receptor [Desulfurococcales archaeon]|nr:helical backbone metal receptor [Desulfurococcales archaeon]